MAETTLTEIEKEEALAFDRRIEERLRAGFVPDLRRAVKCEYFYKSFWRDPHFVDLVLGRRSTIYLELLAKFGGPHLEILDVGCGAGYFSLELARGGHHVSAIDVSASCIEAARATLADNPFKDNFGSLNYRVGSFQQVEGSYDAIVFSGVIHHFSQPDEVVVRAAQLLRPQGLLLCAEPCHESWRPEDAAQVALLRAILSLAGFWFEPSLGNKVLEGDDELRSYVDKVYTEYVTERDEPEQGQSPHDNACSGRDILHSLKKQFLQLDYRPTDSFIYRMLGGLRGPDETIQKIADLLASYDRIGVDNSFIRPNGFIYIGRKISPSVASAVPI